MTRPLKLVAQSLTDETAKNLRLELAGMEWIQFLDHSESLEGLTDHLEKHQPDVVLLDWTEQELATCEWLAEHALNPNASFVAFVLHQNDSPSRLMDAVRYGAREIINYPEDKDSLELGLMRLYSLLCRVSQDKEHINPDEKAELPIEAFRGPSRTIAVFAAKGGAGASSVAVNVAHELATLTKQPVLLLDLDQVFNNTSVMLNLKPSHSLGDLAGYAPHKIEEETLDKICVAHECGLKLLAASKSVMDENEPLAQPLLDRVMHLTHSMFAYVVVDLPSHTLDPYHQYFVDHADDVLVVSGLDVPGLVRTRQYLDLASQFVEEGKLKLVLNRWNLQAAYGMTNKSLENEFRYPIYARLSNDWETNVEANSLGKVISRVNAETPLAKDIDLLTRKLAGLEVPPPAENALLEQSVHHIRKLGGIFNNVFNKIHKTTPEQPLA
jgi:pilus assembly protein CpaE